MISRKQKMQQKSEHCSLGYYYSDRLVKVMKDATLSTPPSTGLSGIQLDDPEIPKIIYNCTEDEVRGVFTTATKAFNVCYCKYKWPASH